LFLKANFKNAFEELTGGFVFKIFSVKTHIISLAGMHLWR